MLAYNGVKYIAFANKDDKNDPWAGFTLENLWFYSVKKSIINPFLKKTLLFFDEIILNTVTIKMRQQS